MLRSLYRKLVNMGKCLKIYNTQPRKDEKDFISTRREGGNNRKRK